MKLARRRKARARPKNRTRHLSSAGSSLHTHTHTHELPRQRSEARAPLALYTRRGAPRAALPRARRKGARAASHSSQDGGSVSPHAAPSRRLAAGSRPSISRRESPRFSARALAHVARAAKPMVANDAPRRALPDRCTDEARAASEGPRAARKPHPALNHRRQPAHSHTQTQAGFEARALLALHTRRDAPRAAEFRARAAIQTGQDGGSVSPHAECSQRRAAAARAPFSRPRPPSAYDAP